MGIFVNFGHDPLFQCRMLQELGGQTHCYHFGENLMNGVIDIQRFFLFFQLTHVPPGKWKPSCAATSIHVEHLL